MGKRVDGKTAIVVGGGQTRGETVGNGRATAMVLAREGARVLVVDRDLASARETVELITGEGGQAWPFEADITSEDAVRRLVAAALERFGRIDLLHNNVGASLALGDAPATDLTVEAFQRSFDLNLKGMWLTCKHALPALRESRGSIVNIASMAARNAYPLVGYKTTKAAVVALTENLGDDERLLIHLNVGASARHLGNGYRSTLLTGVGAQLRTFRGFHFVAEIAYGDAFTGEAAGVVQGGFRIIFNDWVQLDATVGIGAFGEVIRPIWGTTGLRLASDALF